MVNRANSCQSDSSGFLEEPLEPPAPQLLMRVSPLPSSRSPAENGCVTAEGKSPSLQSFQDCHQESDASDSKSMASTSFSSQDWSVLEEKVSSPVEEKESQCAAMEVSSEPRAPEMALRETSTEGRSDNHLQQFLPLAWKEKDANISTVASESDCLSEVLSQSTEWNAEFLRHNGAGEAYVQGYHRESQRSLGIHHSQDRCLFVTSSILDKAESSQFRPDIHNDLIPRKSPPTHVPKAKEVTSHPDEFIPLSENPIPRLDNLSGDTPQRKPWCQDLDHMSYGPEPEMKSFPPNDDSNTDSTKCVTIQMSFSEPSVIQRTVALSTGCRGAILECTPCNHAITEQGLGTAVRQLNDVSVQTEDCEPRLWHCCSVRSNKALTHAPPLTKSLSLDTGLPTVCPVGACHAVPAHCHCICCCHHPHCHTEAQSPIPVPLAYKHCLCSRDHHPEAQFLKTLKSLQETAVRELCSCTVHEMETMKTVCQSFRNYLQEIEENLTRQQTLYAKDMTEEEREEAEDLRTLREALRQQVEELEFQLGDRAQQIREGILLQLELLAGEPESNINLHQHNWPEEMKDLTSRANIHGSMDSTADFSSNDGQQATCSEGPQIAFHPPFASESRSRRVSPPPLRTESGASNSSNCPTEAKDTDAVL